MIEVRGSPLNTSQTETSTETWGKNVLSSICRLSPINSFFALMVQETIYGDGDTNPDNQIIRNSQNSGYPHILICHIVYPSLLPCFVHQVVTNS